VTWPDLDSHLNLVDDPFAGLNLVADRLLPPPGPGLGIALDPNVEGDRAC
jgi:L-alanine-DL-glutamate epimerase-like enolase superfamily enzyme